MSYSPVTSRCNCVCRSQNRQPLSHSLNWRGSQRLYTYIYLSPFFCSCLFAGSLLFLIYLHRSRRSTTKRNENVETTSWHDRQERAHPEESQILAILCQSIKRYTFSDYIYYSLLPKIVKVKGYTKLYSCMPEESTCYHNVKCG